MLKAITFAVGLLLAGTALAQVGQVPGWPPRTAVSAAAPSCNAIITGSGTGSAILTGTATALAKLTCQ